jgi:hypothetical protein
MHTEKKNTFLLTCAFFKNYETQLYVQNFYDVFQMASAVPNSSVNLTVFLTAISKP